MKASVTPLILVLCLVLELTIAFKSEDFFHLYFLDVGQGDAILLKTPEQRYILVDGGEDDVILEELGEVLPFWIKRIDLVIGTHADSDHLGGLVGVMDEYEVGAFATSDLGADDSNLHSILDIAQDRETEILVLNSTDHIQVGKLHLDVIWPGKDFVGENDNQNSVVLQGKYEDFSFLLTGDIESEQESVILENGSSSASTVFKIAHHGSKTATSEDFLSYVSPEYAIISCGEDNKFGHPSKEVLDRLNQGNFSIFRTDKDGRIEFITDGSILKNKLEK